MSSINVGAIEADLSADPTRMVKGIATARQALDAIRGELKKLDDEFNRGAISAAAHTQRLGDLQAASVRLQNAMQGAFTSLQATGNGLDTVGVQANRASRAFGGFGMAMMQAGYIADDFRYGLNAIVNNIAPLTQGLAGGFGATAAQANMAGAAFQVAAVAGYMLYSHWDQLNAALGNPAFKSAAQEMEELGKQTTKTADETKRLADYEAVRASAKKRTESDSASDASEKEIDKAIAGKGGGAVRMGLEKALLEEGGGSLSGKEEQAIRENTRGMLGHIRDAMPVALGGVDIHEEEEKALRKAREDRLQEKTDKLMGGKDATSKAERLALMRKHPELFDKSLTSELESSEPDALKAREEEHQQNLWEREGRKNDAAYVKKKEAKDKQSKADEEARERQFRKENVEVARKTLSGFDQRAEDSAADHVNKGLSREQAIAKATKALMDGEGGKTMSQADAYAAAKDTVGKQYDEFKADPEKLRSHDKKLHRELGERAEEAVPDFKDQVLSLVAKNRVSKIGGGEEMPVKDMIRKSLEGKGFKPHEAAMEAEFAEKEGEHELDKKITHNQLHKKSQKSEVFDTNDLTDKIQAGVGGDEASKQTGLQEKMVAYLTRIAEQEAKGVYINVDG